MMVMLHFRIGAAEHVDLRRGNAGGFQLLFKNFQVVQAVADEIMP